MDSENLHTKKYNLIKSFKKLKVAYLFSTSIVQNPKKYLLIFAIICGVFTPGILSIKSVWSPRMWFDTDHPQIQELNSFEKNFGNDQSVSIGIYNSNGVFNAKSIKTIHTITNALWQVTDIIRVESLTNYNYIWSKNDEVVIEPFISEDRIYSKNDFDDLKKKALNDKTLPNHFVSKDTTYAVIVGHLMPSIDDESDHQVIVDELRKIKKDYQTNDIKISITGAGVANNSFKEVSKSDNRRILPIMIAFLLILIFILFRSFTTLIASFALIGFSIAVTYGWMGHNQIIYNSLLAAIPGVILAIGLADAIHIFNSYFYFRKLDFISIDAIKYSLIKNFQPTLLTSISTAISFFSITFTEIAPVRDLGILCGLGTVVAWIFTYIFLGPFIALLSPLLDKKPIKVLELGKIFYKTKTTSSDQIVAKRSVSIIFKARYFIVTTFFIMVCISVYIAAKNEVNSDPMKYFHESVPVRQAYDFASEKMDGLRGIQLVIDSGRAEGIKDPEFLNNLENYFNYIKQDEKITATRSILEIIKKMNQVLHNDKEEFYSIPKSQKAIAEVLFLYSLGLPQGMEINNNYTLDQRKLRVNVSWNINKSAESVEKSKWLEETGKKFNLMIKTGGNAPIYLNINGLVVKSFFTSMAMAIFFVSLLLFLVYKDLFIGIMAMLPNLIPLIFGGAVMYLMGKSIDIGTSMVTTVCLGMAVDDTIHFVSSYIDNRKKGLSCKMAIQETFNITGKALVITTVLLTVGFGSFAGGDFVPNRNFGILCSIILMMALITDLIFLPALLMIIDNKEKTKLIKAT